MLIIVNERAKPSHTRNVISYRLTSQPLSLIHYQREALRELNGESIGFNAVRCIKFNTKATEK